MATITVVYGKKDLVGVYKEGDLIATHDKFTKRNGDLQRFLDLLMYKDHTIVEKNGDFATFADIPRSLPKEEAVKAETVTAEKPRTRVVKKVEDGVETT